MSKITIYNDGTKDAQAVVINHQTLKPAVHHPMPLEPESTRDCLQIDLASGDLIIITLADKA